MSFLYFIGSIGGPIKIGHSLNPDRRRSALQSGSSKPLLVLAAVPGGPTEERQYHKLFDHLRLSGEWFEPDAALLAEVWRLAGQSKTEVHLAAMKQHLTRRKAVKPPTLKFGNVLTWAESVLILSQTARPIRSKAFYDDYLAFCAERSIPADQQATATMFGRALNRIGLLVSGKDGQGMIMRCGAVLAPTKRRTVQEGCSTIRRFSPAPPVNFVSGGRGADQMIV